MHIRKIDIANSKLSLPDQPGQSVNKLEKKAKIVKTSHNWKSQNLSRDCYQE